MSYTAEDAMRDILADIQTPTSEGEYKEYLVFSKAMAYDRIVNIVVAFQMSKLAKKKPTPLTK